MLYFILYTISLLLQMTCSMPSGPKLPCFPTYCMSLSILLLMDKFLGALQKLWRVTESFIVSVNLYAHLFAWNNSAPTGWTFMKFDIWPFFENHSRKIKVLIKSDKSNRYFTWRPIYIFDHISLISKEKFIRQKM